MTWLNSNIVNPAVPGVYQNFLLTTGGEKFYGSGWSFWDGHVWGNTRQEKRRAELELQEALCGFPRAGLQTKQWKATSYNVVTPGRGQKVWFPIEPLASTLEDLDLCFSRGDVYDIEVK